MDQFITAVNQESFNCSNCGSKLAQKSYPNGLKTRLEPGDTYDVWECETCDAKQDESQRCRLCAGPLVKTTRGSVIKVKYDPRANDSILWCPNCGAIRNW